MATFPALPGAYDLNAAATYGGTAPASMADGDIVVFAEGGTPSSAYVNVNALDAKDFNRIQFQPRFTASFGTASAPITVRANNGSSPRVEYSGGGASWHVTGGASVRTIAQLWFTPTSGAVGSIVSAALSGLLLVGSGTFTVGATCAMASFLCRSNALLIIEASAATDTVSDGELVDRAVVRLKRDFTGTITVNSGTTLYLDYNGTTSGTIKLNGGTVIVERGTHTIDGGAGTVDASKFIGSGTITYSRDTPSLIERYGPNKPTLVYSSTIGTGGNKFTDPYSASIGPRDGVLLG